MKITKQEKKKRRKEKEMNTNTNKRKQVDSYSMLIVMKYLQTKEDLLNVIMTNSKYENSLDKFHFNPIPLTPKVIEMFPNLETAHYYSRNELKYLKRFERKVFWYETSYSERDDNPDHKYMNVVLRNNGMDENYLQEQIKAECRRKCDKIRCPGELRLLLLF